MNKRNGVRNDFCSKDLPVEEGAGCEVNHRKPLTETSSEANSPSRGNSETDSDSKN